MVKFRTTLLVLIAFAIPLSTSVVSILSVLLGLVWIIEGNFKEKFKELLSNEVCIAVLIYLGLYCLGMLWTDNVGDGISVLKRYWKLLLMPIFLTAIPIDQRHKVIYGFMAGLLIMVIGTYLAWFDLLHYGGVTPEHPTRKLYHVVYNPMLALGCYLVAHELIWGRRSTAWRIALAVTALVMIINMFITEGRAGQVAFFVLLVVLLLQFFKDKKAKGLILAVVLIPLLFVAGYKLSPNFHGRVDKALHEIEIFHSHPQTSTGYRLYFWEISWDVFKTSPLIGVGTGDYNDVYALKNKEHFEKDSMVVMDTTNPHNQYVLVLCQLGLVGFAVFLSIFYLQIRNSVTSEDEFKRIRLAFPLLFLTIMLSESYLVVNETGFLFSLFSGVLYKRPRQGIRKLDGQNDGYRKWLILAYFFNSDGKAASQTITDRIPLLLEEKIMPIVLSSPLGFIDERFPHSSVFSAAPSGLLYEMRFLLKKKEHFCLFWKIVKAIVTVFLLPFYIIERSMVYLDSHWSWGISGVIKGFFLIFVHKPEVIYSTAGPSSTHLAGFLLHKFTGIPWVAEIHDPLVYDFEKGSLKQRYRFNNWLEKKICSHACAVIYFTNHALQSANRRHSIQGKKVVLRPGAAPPKCPDVVYAKRNKVHFAHFGSLAEGRNLALIFQALHNLFKENPKLVDIVSLDIYGSQLDKNSKNALNIYSLENVLKVYGRIEFDPLSGKTGRQQVVEAMKRTDVLLVLHGSDTVCEEYIPSKVYEYLLLGRPILGFTPPSTELGQILLRCGHSVVDPDNVESIQNKLIELINIWKEKGLENVKVTTPYTIDRAVKQLIEVVDEVC